MAKYFDYDDLFNENLYLQAERDSKIVQTILSKKEEKESQYEALKKYYSFSIDKYNEFLTFIAKFIKELKADDNTIVLSVFLRKLIYDCYFSNSSYIDRKPDNAFLFDVPFHDGLDVIVGQGNSRHIARFYDDLYEKLDIPCDMITCFASDHELRFRDASTRLPNYFVNTMKSGNEIYVYDAPNDIVLRFIDLFAMQEITNDEKKANYYYKPSGDVLYCGVDYDMIFDRLQMFYNDSKKGRHIDPRKLLDLRTEAEQIFLDHRELLSDFKDEAKIYTKKISEGLFLGRTQYTDDTNND